MMQRLPGVQGRLWVAAFKALPEHDTPAILICPAMEKWIGHLSLPDVQFSQTRHFGV